MVVTFGVDYVRTMFGSLIGVFITVAGIVVGTDSVLWGSATPGATRVDKICQPSARSVAALEGWYGEELYLHRRFLEACEAQHRSSKAVSVEDQADRLVRKLQQAYQHHAGRLPSATASLPPPGSKHVLFVVVAGFEGQTPMVTVRELRWDKAREGRWRLVTERVGKHSFQECGAKLLGEDRVAALLLDTSAHFGQEKRRQDVRAASRANRLRQEENCLSSAFTLDDAKSFYMTAVRLTIDYGEEFHIENGAVGGILHLFTIPPEGPVKEEMIDPEHYVGEQAGSANVYPEPLQTEGGGSS